MSALVVVGNPRDWPLAIPDVDVVAARAYLTDPAYGKERGLRVYNLCKSYRYQSLGYYVSLLAEARGHRPLPRISAIEDLQSQNLVRLLSASLDQLATKSLASIKSDEFTLSIYFGRNIAARYDLLSRQIFDLFQVPLLRAKLTRSDDIWQVSSVRTIAASDIPPQHQDFVVEAARKYFAGRQTRPHHRRPPRFDLAILHDRGSRHPASNERAIEKFEHAAQALGIQAEVISHSDLGRLGRFDGLFIRDNTFINHYTYRFSRRAAAEGLVVIDDPDSILRCNNKVFLAELLPRHGIPVPQTLIVDRENLALVVPSLGLPCVLKRPDSSLSLGVAKIESESELRATALDMLQESDLIIAQEYRPTPFDWRIGILAGRPLFVCKYHMVPGHWQIVRHVPGRHYEECRTEALPLDAAPAGIVELALKAARPMGDGFYGVDVKETAPGDLRVIEVNDNPNVDAGNEDGVLQDDLYREVMRLFAQRMAAHRERLR